MGAYCGRCGRRMWGKEWAETRPYGDFTLEVVGSLGGRGYVALCEGGHWFLWRRTQDGIVTATLPHRIGKVPTWDEVLAALRGGEANSDG